MDCIKKDKLINILSDLIDCRCCEYYSVALGCRNTTSKEEKTCKQLKLDYFMKKVEEANNE
jgi:hypothetical protein